MRFTSLNEWLDWQLQLHFKSIDLGLERVSKVAKRLGIERIAKVVVIVAGTNGKGSTVACYENWLKNAGYTVASYTSPHLLNYNERLKLDLQTVSDDELCGAFDAIDQARENIALTYFEFGTLAAIWLIQKRQPDFAILEVGLGGRLDAVNIIDADLVHLTSIGIDHQNWLGSGREKIGYEKAGVLRRGIPVVCNDIEPPQSVIDEINRLACFPMYYMRDFSMSNTDKPGYYHWSGDGFEFDIMPPLPGLHQVQNIAGVLAGLSKLLDFADFDSSFIQQNFKGTQLAGRFENLKTDIPASVYIDVGHNQDAAKALSTNLAGLKNGKGRIIVLLGMLEDKDSAGFVQELAPQVDQWWLLTLDGERGLTAPLLAARLDQIISVDHTFNTISDAIDHAMSSVNNQDIILITGSFITVELFLRALPATQSNTH